MKSMLKIAKQNLLIFTVCFILLFGCILASVNDFCTLIFSVGFTLDTLLIYGLYVALFVVLSVTHILKKLKTDILFVCMAVLLALGLTVFLFSENTRYMWTSLTDFMSNPVYNWIVFSITGYILTRYIEDYGAFLRMFEIFSVVTLLMGTVQLWLSFNGHSSNFQYMTFSYNILLQTSLMALLCLREFKLYRAILAVAGALMMFIAGCRGSVLSLIVVIVLYPLSFGKLSRRRKVTLCLIGIGLILLFLLFWKEIFLLLIQLSRIVGYESRTLSRILNGMILDDSGRFRTWMFLIDSINLIGRGLWGDRALLSGGYAHNLLIEWLIQFGWIGGSVLIIAFFALLIGALVRSGKDSSLLLCVLTSTGLVKLFLSSSYLHMEPSFYVLLGLCISLVRGRNKQ